MVRWGALLGMAICLGFGGVAQAACSLTRIAELPITVDGFRPLVPAKVNGTDVQFIVDSGAFFSAMSPAAAAMLHLPVSDAPYGLRMAGVGGEVKVQVARVKALTLTGSTLPDLEFLVGGSDIEAPSVGLIGQNLLRIGDVDYDLAHGAIRLMKPRGCEHTDLAYWGGEVAYSVLSVESTNALRSHTIGIVLVNGARIRATFDTGAPTTIISVGAAARAGVRPSTSGVALAGFSGGIGRRFSTAWTVPIKSFQIGDEKIMNTRIRMADLGPDTDMLVGLDFFLSHRVYVANSQRKIYLSYAGGPVFNLDEPAMPAAPKLEATIASAASAPAPDDPKDADGFSRRAGARSGRRQFTLAVADLDRACALAPTEARYFRQRAAVHLAMDQDALAITDLDTALKLTPSDAEARVQRASLRLATHDKEGARGDLDAAATFAAKEADLRLQIATLYLEVDAFTSAIAQFDLWTAVHGEDSRLPLSLNGRCWARALAGSELDKALDDCNAALRLVPHAASFLDSRGLVRLRRGELDRAAADYNAALTLQPKLAWSLYGRGLVELKTGEKAKGDADISAAVQIAPELAARATRLGLSPTEPASLGKPGAS